MLINVLSLGMGPIRVSSCTDTWYIIFAGTAISTMCQYVGCARPTPGPISGLVQYAPYHLEWYGKL